MNTVGETASFLALGALLISGAIHAAPTEYAAQSDDTPILHISQGDIVGVKKVTDSGTKYLGFLGIPYAEPPIGDLRFKDPKPLAKWDGVLAARTEGNICQQPTKKPTKMFNGMTKKMMGMMKTMASLPNVAKFGLKHLTGMSEDCLFLNVFTPVEALPTDKLMPVLAFIHGGAFSLGEGDTAMYGPEYLMDNKGLVVVTMNYRLGPLGFLSTNTSDAPGNAGLKDQRLALRWIRDNIKSFGGDPSMVTIYGESAGSYSVHMHVLSPGSSGLFRGAILSSSLSPNPYGFVEDPVGMSKRLAESAGADKDTTEDPAKRVQFLRDMPAKELYSKMMSALNENDLHSLSRAFPWAVVAEAKDTPDPFMTRHPNDILREGDFTKVPLMVGMNNKEGSLVLPMASEEGLQRLRDNPTMFVPEAMKRKLDDEKTKSLANKILETYFKGKAIGADTVDDLVDLFGDETLAHGISVGSRWHLKHATPQAPVYLYFFTLDAFGAISLLIAGGQEVKGAGHADDLGYIFKVNFLNGLEIPNKESFDKGRARMTQLISNFVMEGVPTPKTTAEVSVNWPAATADQPRYLEIGSELAVKEGLPLSDRLAFWDQTYKEVMGDPLYDV